jgi:taurine dioxygenase
MGDGTTPRSTVQGRNTDQARSTRLGGTLGARIDGLDLARELDTGTFAWLREQLLAHHVLVFPGQDMAPEDEVAFARRWGAISVHPYVKGLPGHPEVLEVIGASHRIAVNWHQDQTYRAKPPAITMLLARTLPEAGADTMFANQHAAFAQLSPALQETLVGLRAVHRGTERAADAGLSMVDVEQTHPVAPRHPETGRRMLFVNPDYTVAIDGWTDAESRPLLEQLYRWSTRPEFTFRHRWSPGDFVLWDNRNLLHCVVADATGDRLLHKVTVEGDVPLA